MSNGRRCGCPASAGTPRCMDLHPDWLLTHHRFPWQQVAARGGGGGVEAGSGRADLMRGASGGARNNTWPHPGSPLPLLPPEPVLLPPAKQVPAGSPAPGTTGSRVLALPGGRQTVHAFHPRSTRTLTHAHTCTLHTRLLAVQLRPSLGVWEMREEWAMCPDLHSCRFFILPPFATWLWGPSHGRGGG